MAKQSSFTSLTGANVAAGDTFPVLDISDTTMAATGTNKQISLNELREAITNLPNTTFADQTGVIEKNGSRFIHNFNYGNNGTVTTEGDNTLVGENAGNLTMGSTATATYEGSRNTYIGHSVGMSTTTGFNNTYNGRYAGYNTTTAFNGAFFGREAGYHVTTGGNNAFFGDSTGQGITTGTGNSILGAGITGLAAGLTNNIILASGGTARATFDGTHWSFTGTIKTTGYTVGTLPAAGTAGRRAYVTDATAPTYLGALTGGGAVVCPVFDNGAAWVSA